MRHNVFVIMPFREDFVALFDELKDYFSEDYEFVNAGDIDNQQNILKDIVKGISSSEVVIADLTGNNPNVFYELGLAHAMNKKVIIITQDIDELPFDIKSYRVSSYSLLFYKIQDLKKELKKNLDGAIDGTVAYGNPVSDFLPYYDPKHEYLDTIDEYKASESDNNSQDNIIEYEDGILDYIADIQDSSNYMLEEMKYLSNDIHDLNNDINNSTMEINRVKAQSGNLDLSFVRKVCRKLGLTIEDFSKNMDKHVDVILEKWCIIENSFLLMFESPIMKNSSKKESIKESIDSLNKMQISISNSKNQIATFATQSNQVLGYERTLNKSINSLINSFEKYNQATEQMYSSIDRIKSKGNIILE